MRNEVLYRVKDGRKVHTHTTKEEMQLGWSDSWQLSNLTHKFVSMYLFIYSSLHVSSMSCSSSGETDYINTASGNCHSVLVAGSCASWEFYS